MPRGVEGGETAGAILVDCLSDIEMESEVSPRVKSVDGSSIQSTCRISSVHSGIHVTRANQQVYIIVADILCSVRQRRVIVE